MLPYVELPRFGPIQSFGVLVVLGCFFGVAAGLRHAERLGLDLTQSRRIASYCGIGGLVGAHYVDLLFYQPGWLDQPDALWRFVNPFGGISSYGGLVGGTLGFFLATRRTRNRLSYADAAALGVLVLLTFGRAGCASVHDHVGVASDFALAVDFPPHNPSGVVGPHHDLGLYELAWLLVLLLASGWFLHRPRRPGLYVGMLALAYAVPRCFLDLLRREASDPRYLGLTPAQWCCLATVVSALLVLRIARRQSAPERHLPVTSWRTHLRGVVMQQSRRA